MPKVDLAAVPTRKGCGYPPPFDAPCAPRTRRRLGEAGGLRDFGVNLMTLPPGSWSSQRHWHSHEDEFSAACASKLFKRLRRHRSPSGTSPHGWSRFGRICREVVPWQLSEH